MAGYEDFKDVQPLCMLRLSHEEAAYSFVY